MSLTLVQIILYIIQENTEYLCEFWSKWRGCMSNIIFSIDELIVAVIYLYIKIVYK